MDNIDFNELLQLVTKTSYKNLFNSKNMENSCLYKGVQNNKRLYSSKIVENFISNCAGLDLSYSKINSSIWLIKSDTIGTHIHIINDRNSLSLNDERLIASKFLNVKDNFLNISNVFFFNFGNYEIKIKKYFQSSNKTLHLCEYDTLEGFMYEVYNIDCSKYINEKYKQILNPSYENKDFGPIVSSIERNGLDNNVSKIELILYEDLLKNIDNGRCFFSNIDAIYKDNRNNLIIVELKNKTKDNGLIVNEHEYNIYKSLSNEFRFFYCVMFSLNEEKTRENIINNNYVYGDAELYYYIYNKDHESFIENRRIRNQKTRIIPKRLLTRFNKSNLILKYEKESKTNLLNQKFMNDNFFNEIPLAIITHLKEKGEISSIFDVNITACEEENHALFIEIPKQNTKYYIKSCMGRAWRVSININYLEDLKSNKNVTHVLIIQLDDNSEKNNIIKNAYIKNYEIIGYKSIDDFIEESNWIIKKSNSKIDLLETNPGIKRALIDKTRIFNQSSIEEFRRKNGYCVASINDSDRSYLIKHAKENANMLKPYKQFKKFQ